MTSIQNEKINKLDLYETDKMAEVKETWTLLNILVSNPAATVSIIIAHLLQANLLLFTLSVDPDCSFRDIWLVILWLLHDHHRIYLGKASFPRLYATPPWPGQR